MKIIRDEECHGIMMIPLLYDWRIHRCNYRDCEEKPNTIVLDIHPEAPKAIGLCEKHYQCGNKPGGHRMDLEFSPTGGE